MLTMLFVFGILTSSAIEARVSHVVLLLRASNSLVALRYFSISLIKLVFFLFCHQIDLSLSILYMLFCIASGRLCLSDQAERRRGSIGTLSSL